MKYFRLMFAAISFAVLVVAAPPVVAQDPAAASTEAGETIDASGGTLFVPEGWNLSRDGEQVVITAPEGDFTVTIVSIIDAADGDAAVASAWNLSDPDFARSIRLAQDLPARDGWEAIRVVNYDIPPADDHVSQGVALLSNGIWTAVLVDGALPTVLKRQGQLSQITGSFRPAGFEKESFAGLSAHELDEKRVLKLKDFLREGMDLFGVPGVGFALIEDGEIVYEGGLGTKHVGHADPIDENTRFMIASNTKGMATLLLSTLVDDGLLDWEQKVTDVYPSFRLGSDETTAKTLIKHLVCACTGLPRKDMEWLFNTPPDLEASDTFHQLAATEPTTGFGEVFQYNNLMASAAGYVGGHIVYPELEVGAAFDKAIKERVFDPLGMSRTTFDNALATEGNWAQPHDYSINRSLVVAPMEVNYAVHPYRPAGAAWSTAHDMALYVLNELREGVLPNGEHYVSKEALFARRVHNVPVGENRWYGMGLFDDAEYGVSVIQHGGSLVGYMSNWFAIPEAGVGAVLLTNSSQGQALLGPFQRKLLEVLYDGKDEAEENLTTAAERANESRAKFFSELTYPPDPEVVADLAKSYANPALGPLTVTRDSDSVWIKTTSLNSLVATKKNEDGTISLVMVSPGMMGMDLLIGDRDRKKTLRLNDGQHEYFWIEE